MKLTALTWLLRFGGLLLCSATFAVFMPRESMIATNAALGLDPLPALPLTFYLARSTSILYALHGVVLLLASSDLVRYRPLISLLGSSNLVFGTIMLGIDITSNMPWWWTMAEGPLIIAAGVALIVLVRRVPVSDFTVRPQRADGPAGTRLTSAATRAGVPAPSPSEETS
jgi:hypothetical protein